jgi:hypothetical protein
VYVYDTNLRRLFQYETGGLLLGTIHVDDSRWLASVRLHLVGERIYAYACHTRACGDFVIGEIHDGTLRLPRKKSGRSLERGIFGPSGRKYLARMKMHETGFLDISDGDAPAKTVSVAPEGIISIDFLGEDSQGNFYLKTGTRKDKKVFIQVHKFGPKGTLMSTMEIPRGTAAFAANKYYTLDRNGKVYRFLPQERSLRLEIYEME